MQYVYVALAVFAALASLVPIGMVISAKLLSPKYPGNDAKGMNYESGEEPIGEHKDITNDYLAYFPAFLAFEIVCVIAVLWSLVYSAISVASNEYILCILAAATVTSMLVTALVQSRHT